MSHREYTQNVKNWHASFNRKNTLMMPLSKWRIIVATAFVGELSSDRTYQNLEENRSIFTEIQTIFLKICWCQNMQIKILSSEAIMMTSWVNWGSNETWKSISPNHTLSKYGDKKSGSSSILKSYNGFCMGMFLPIYAMYYKSSRARKFMLNGRSFRY